MIIVNLAGGLGNQMFEYACGRALAHKYNVPLYLDHSFLEDKSPKVDFTYRDYELNAFGIDLRIDKNRLNKIGLNKAYNQPYTTLFSIKRVLHGYKYFSQKGFGIDSRIDHIGPKVYLTGYYQNEYYFKEIPDIIRKDFTFIPTQIEENKELLQKIKNCENPVAIHIRRGDYLTLGGGKIHGICTLEYYKEAAQIIKNKIANPTFFVFSADDPDWAKQNLDIDAPFEVIGIKNTGKLGFENMRLMSNCNHNIIANSSFSWWGAWLNPNPNKIVIAPKIWFMESVRDEQISSIVPSQWIRI